MPDFLITEAFHQVVVHHPGGLHEGVADSGAHEFKATLFQGFAHGIRFGCADGNLFDGFPVIDFGFTPGELPDESIETARFLLDFKKYPGIGNR